MVSFRFHIVSIVAVFLALALGIGMGVTVIDKATVDLLQRRLDSVRSEVNAANQRSDDLQRQLARSGAYESRAEDLLVDRKLTNVPVTIIGFRGIDQTPVNDLKRVLDESGALVQGTLWVPVKSRLDDPKAASTLQKDLAGSSADPAPLRQQLVTRIAAVMAGASESNALRPLVDDGFLEWEPDVASNDVSKVVFGAARIVVASGFNADVPSEQLAFPLVKLLAAAPVRRVVAVESGREPDARTSGERAVFLGPVRGDGALDDRVSTVDNLEVSPGRVATVLALSQLPDRVGDYGYAGSAEGTIPKPRT